VFEERFAYILVMGGRNPKEEDFGLGSINI